MKYLIIVAHPDDEILGCFTTISWAIRAGNEVMVEIFSQRSKTREKGLKAKALKIHERIGITKTVFKDYETMKFDKYDRYEMTLAVEKAMKEFQPDYIITHDINDIHNDHRILAEIVLEASKLPLRGTGYSKPLKGIYTMEIPSSTDWGSGFVPNAFFEAREEDLKMKEELMKEYADVIRDLPHPRNAESFYALARYRGGQCGCKYAEAFRKIYEVNV